MREIKKVVIPVDFSSNTEKLVDYGLYVADKFAAPVHLIYVVAPIPVDAMVGATLTNDYFEQALAQAKGRMEELLTSLKEEHPDCTGEVVSGDPVEMIIASADACDADLIVISTHGVKGLERILLGSVTARVVKRALCPVLVLNPFLD